MTDPGGRTPPIASVVKAIAMLAFVARTPDGATATETARGLDVPVPTAYQLLNTLVGEGALEKGADRRYRLGTRIAVLADAYLSRPATPEALLAPLRRLASETGETAYLSGWRDGELAVLDVEEGSQAVRVADLERGTPGSAHARASGKLLLAHRDAAERDAYLDAHPLERLTEHTCVEREALERAFAEIRRSGVAFDEEEFAVGVECVAAPIVSDGVVIGAYTVSAPRDRFRERRETLVRAVVDAAALAGRPGR